MARVIIIGIDGATFDLLSPWIDKGKLSSFSKIYKEGAHGRLRSTTPYYSAPAWVSMVTGCQPGKHGIYDFFRTDTFSKKLVNARMRKVPAIWQYLTDVDKTSIAVNVPGTYPPDPIKGVMITGLLTPSPESSFTYPASIKKELTKDNLGEYELEQVGIDDIPKNLYAQYAPEKLVQKIMATMESHAEVTLKLMQNYPWDFAMMVFRGTDDAQHLLWNTPEHILTCYKMVDRFLGQFILLFPDDYLLLVSDHGFEKPKRYLYVNNVLYNKGYLKTVGDPNYNIGNLLMEVFDKISRWIFRFLPMEELVRSPLGRKIILSDSGGHNIDFSHTKAFYHSVCSRGIRITLKEKYKEGIVERAEYQQLREELKQLFLSLKDPETKKPIVQAVYDWEEVYGKDAMNDPLDLILELHREYGAQELLRSPEGLRYALGHKGQQLSYVTPPGFYDWMGDHSPYGIFMIHGENVKKNSTLSPHIIDVVPTALALLKVPIPNRMDGSVLQEAFSQSIQEHHVDWNQDIQKEPHISSVEKTAIAKLQLQLKKKEKNQ